MNKKFVLTLLSSPVLFASMMSMVMMGRAAASPSISPSTRLSCVMSPHSATPKKVCIEVSNTVATVTKNGTQVAQVQPNQVGELEFTDKESDEALKLFGCDCPVCINALRQLHGQAPLPV
jgi:hypothetical protein